MQSSLHKITAQDIAKLVSQKLSSHNWPSPSLNLLPTSDTRPCLDENRPEKMRLTKAHKWPGHPFMKVIIEKERKEMQ